MNDIAAGGTAIEPSNLDQGTTRQAAGGTHWPQGEGAMGERIRNHDWSATPLGPIDTWPQSLRTLVDLMLGSRQPVYIAWGPALTSLYNDSYVPILGIKHPDALGKAYKELFAEIWDEYRPIVEATMGGEAQHFADRPVALSGRPGRPMSWFTFSWTPVCDEAGTVAGFYCAATETTDRIQSDGALRESNETALRESEMRYHALFQSLGQGFCILQLILDENEKPVDYRYIEINGVFEEQTGIRNALGRTIRELVPDIELFWFDIYGKVALTGKPMRFVNHAPSMGRWFDVYAFRIGEPHERQVAVLFNDITDRKRAEEALRDSEARLRQVQEAARIGSFEFDRLSGRATASLEYLELYGLPDDRAESFSYEEWIALVHPDDRARVESETRSAVADPARFQLDYEFRISRADTGKTRWITARTKLLRDASGRFVRSLGAQWDVTSEKNVEAALRKSEERYRSFIAHSSEGIWLLEFSPPLDTSLPTEEQIDLAYRNGRFVDCNDAMARMYGLARAEDLIGKTLDFPLPASDPEARAYLAGIIHSGYSITNLESVEQDADGSQKHFANSMIGVVEDGQLKRLWGIQRDITDQKKAEEQRTLLINELNHRVKNTLATVQSIASQTLRNAPTAQEAKKALEERLIALSRAHDVLTRESWEGAELREIVAQALAPYSGQGEDRLHLKGPELRLSPRMALALAMALQELATNAVKYGALSNSQGEVEIAWEVEQAGSSSRLHLRWEESGGPLVHAPVRKGFGSRLIERSLAHDLNGTAQIEFRPEGVVCTVDAPLS
jgi:PAS domain S-box-containing protein